MKGNMKKIFLILLLVAFIGISIFMFISEEYSIAAFCLLFTFIIAILLHRNISRNKSPESLYKATISDILKTYDAILVEVENLPDISNKKLIQTISFKDMVNAEYEFRKPIYYIHNDYAHDFILFNKDDAYVYTVKIGNEQMSIVENYLAEKIKEKVNSSSDLDMLDSLENTTVIKLNEDKEYLVSPIRNQEQKQVPEVATSSLQNNQMNNSDTVSNVSTINNDSLDTMTNSPQTNISSTNNAVITESPVSNVSQSVNIENNMSNINDAVITEPSVSGVSNVIQNVNADSNVSSTSNSVYNVNNNV